MCGENFVSSRVQVNLETKKYKRIVQSMWMIAPRHHISTEVTVKGFKKCCIFSAVDETDDDILWNGSEEDGNVLE